MTPYTKGFKDGLRDVMALCETIENKRGTHGAEIAASVTAGMIRKAIQEKLLVADQLERAASTQKGRTQ